MTGEKSPVFLGSIILLNLLWILSDILFTLVSQMEVTLIGYFILNGGLFIEFNKRKWY